VIGPLVRRSSKEQEIIHMKTKNMNTNGAPLVAAVRLQLNPETHFGFAQAHELLGYFHDLGLSHIYLSPFMKAAPGSTHAYDPVSFTEICPVRGGEAELNRLSQDGKSKGIYLIGDTIPNHMARYGGNPFWDDEALRRVFFDVDPTTGEYRTYWDFGHLPSLKTSDPVVRARAQEGLLKLVKAGVLQAIRVDHPDGLEFPDQYAEWLTSESGVPVWFEKADRPGENIPAVCAGTTGSEFLRDTMALFHNGQGRSAILSLYHDLTGDTRNFAQVHAEVKMDDATRRFRAQVHRLWRVLGVDSVSEDDVAQAAGSFDYRLYIDLATRTVDAKDRKEISAAPINPRLRSILLLEEGGHDEFIRLFQPLLAEVGGRSEITAKYRYCPLLSINELGCDPDNTGITASEWLIRAAGRQVEFPLTMNTLENHDSLISTDARARLLALTYVPTEWAANVRQWFKVNASLHKANGGPSVKDEYRLYQVLMAVGFADLDRLNACVIKAICEDGALGPVPGTAADPLSTNWMNRNEAYETAVKDFLAALYTHEAFRSSFDSFAAKVNEMGRRISLSQNILKLTAPGFPDIYQGSELEYLALQDPDNRLPVDWDARVRALAGLTAGEKPTVETAKLYTLMQVLHLRRRHQDSFLKEFSPVESGEGTIAYKRGDNVVVMVAVDPSAQITKPAGDGWVNVLEAVSDLGFQVGVFERQ